MRGKQWGFALESGRAVTGGQTYCVDGTGTVMVATGRTFVRHQDTGHAGDLVTIELFGAPRCMGMFERLGTSELRVS